MKTLTSNLLFLLIAGVITIGVGTVTYNLSTPSGANVAGEDQTNKETQSTIEDQNNQSQNPINDAVKTPIYQKSGYDSDGDGENENEGDDDNEGGLYTTTPKVTTPAPTKTVPKTTTPTSSTTKSYTKADVATHNTSSNCWTIVNGNVYNLTSYVTQHPGGQRRISSICGIDGSMAFDNQHGGSSRPEAVLQSLLIGPLK